MPGGIGRALKELATPVETAQRSRIANQMDVNLWKEHPGIDQTTASMLNGRATKYLSQQTTTAKPQSAIAYFTKEQWESKFGKVDAVDTDEAEKIRNYYWQLKTGDGIEDLVVLKSKAGMVIGVEGKPVAAAMWRVNPKAKIPVLVETPGNDWSVTPLRQLSYRGVAFPIEVPKYQPPVKPKWTVPGDDKMGRMTFDPDSPMTGDIATMDRGSDTRQVVMSFVPEKFRNQGRGIAMYEELANQTLSEGKRLVSDTQVSPDAAKMYDALEKRGFTVKRNEFETDEDGTLRSTNSRPVFEVVPGKKKETSPTLDKQAE